MLCEAMLRVQNALLKYHQIVPIRAAHTSDTDQVASGASVQMDGLLLHARTGVGRTWPCA